VRRKSVAVVVGKIGGNDGSASSGGKIHDDINDRVRQFNRGRSTGRRVRFSL